VVTAAQLWFDVPMHRAPCTAGSLGGARTQRRPARGVSCAMRGVHSAWCPQDLPLPLEPDALHSDRPYYSIFHAFLFSLLSVSARPGAVA
jgi:hypothetical protein